MNPSLPINDPYQTDPCWLAARRSQNRIQLVNSANKCTALTPINLLRARSDRPPYRIGSAKISLHPSCCQILSITGVPKSP